MSLQTSKSAFGALIAGALAMGAIAVRNDNVFRAMHGAVKHADEVGASVDGVRNVGRSAFGGMNSIDAVENAAGNTLLRTGAEVDELNATGFALDAAEVTLDTVTSDQDD